MSWSSAGAGAQQQQGETASSEKAGEGEPVRTVDVPAAGQPIRQNQAAVRERLMPKLAELEQVCRLYQHEPWHGCALPSVWQLKPHSAEADQVCKLPMRFAILAACYQVLGALPA